MPETYVGPATLLQGDWAIGPYLSTEDPLAPGYVCLGGCGWGGRERMGGCDAELDNEGGWPILAFQAFRIGAHRSSSFSTLLGAKHWILRCDSPFLFPPRQQYSE